MAEFSVGKALFLIITAISSTKTDRVFSSVTCSNTSKTIYDYAEKDLFEQKLIRMSNFRGKQEPGGNGQEIFNGIKYVRPGNGFVPNFPVTKKIDVNGKKENLLYTFLKASCPPTRDYFVPSEKLFYSPMRNSDVRWNFEKFLISHQGKPVKRYDPTTRVSEIEKDIERVLRSK